LNSRTALILVAAIFIVSPIVAWLFHIGVFQAPTEPGSGKNHGELVHPARPLEGLELRTDSNEAVSIDNFLGLWTMLQYAASPCVDDCMKNIYKMRQIRLALGKDAHRVQRAVVAESTTDMRQLMQDNPGTLLFRLTPQSQSLLTRFPGYIEGDISSIGERIYIIDPLGNLMMKYEKDADPSGVLKDLRQLLKATWIRPKT